MNINPIIVAALSSLNLPVWPNVYKGEESEYIIFNYSDESPSLRADDTDLYDETTVRVHYFTKSSPQANKKIIRKLLREAGFTIIDTLEIYEDDTEYNHVIVEASIDGEITD